MSMPAPLSRRALLALLLTVSIVSAAPLPSAAEPSTLVQGGESIGHGLYIRDADGVHYVSGGIGSDQKEALQRAGSQFNLKLTMATADAKLIGKADVVITDQNGRTVLAVPSDGPLFFAKLQPGKYDVTATFKEKSLTRAITAPRQGQAQLVLTWPHVAD
jgi:hypothetical protein